MSKYYRVLTRETTRGDRIKNAWLYNYRNGYEAYFVEKLWLGYFWVRVKSIPLQPRLEEAERLIKLHAKNASYKNKTVVAEYEVNK